MADLPINNKEFKSITIMTDFIARMRGFFEHEKLKRYKFSPQLNGYEISFEYKKSEVNVKIEFKKKLFASLIKVTAETKCSDGKVIKKEYKTKSSEDNETVVKQIIADCE